MKANNQRLGDYIRQVDVRNTDLSISRLLGVNLSKEFFPSIANIVGTDLSKYKVIKKHQFGCKFMSVGRDGILPISILLDDDPAIISSAYYAFEVNDPNELLPEYLMLHFRKPEFDRQLWFRSGGDVRGGINFNDFCDMPFVLPPIEEQRRIVAQYQTVENRIRNNKRLIAHLEDTAQSIFHHCFVENIDHNNLPVGWKMATIEEFGKVITGKTPSSDNPEDFGDNTPFVTPGDFWNYEKFAIGAERGLSIVGTKRLQNKLLPSGAVMVTCIGSDMGKIAVATEECITNQQLNSIVPYQKAYTDYLFYSLLLKTRELKSMALGASTMPLLNKGDFERIDILMPPYELLVDFTRLLLPLNNMVIMKLKEDALLSEAIAILINRL